MRKRIVKKRKVAETMQQSVDQNSITKIEQEEVEKKYIKRLFT